MQLRKMKICSLMVLLVLVLVGCAQDAQVEVQAYQPERPERPADYMATVRKVIANELTVTAYEVSDTVQRALGATQEGGNTRPSVGALGGLGGGGAVMGGIQSGGMPAIGGQRSGSAVIGGESMTIIIPVGTPIMTASITGRQQGINMEQVSQNQIKVGTTLMIWLEEGEADEPKTAEFVQLVAAGAR